MEEKKESINYSASEYKKAEKILKICNDRVDEYKNPTREEIIEYIRKTKKEKGVLPNLKEFENIINELNSKDRENLDFKKEMISMIIYGTEDRSLLRSTAKFLEQEEIELKKKIERRNRY